ncbi:MAG: thiol protease/hemagglutinin PrtT [Prolixibacteraceae bacterium]|nr:thiol protease/hemagglutinin PrtT [Prolixibacteraceae bacterium]
MKKQAFFLIIFLAFNNLLYSSPVDSITAKTVAKNFYLSVISRNDTLLKSAQIEGLTLSLVHQQNNNSDAVLKSTLLPFYYIFNVNENEGWIIVSANDAVTPILGYSLSGKYDNSIQAPPAYVTLMKYYERQIEYVQQNSDQFANSPNEKWKEYLAGNSLKSAVITKSVNPLLETNWDQGCDYNKYCPDDIDGPCDHALAGCVAVPMAQVMHYWEYPVSCEEIPGYTPPNYFLEIDNILPTTYNWEDMSSTSSDAVAKLIYHCGVALKMDYGPESSSAYFEDIAPALKTYFKYTSNIQTLSRADYDDSEWSNLIKEELNNGRPVLYSGHNSDYSIGHVFICDGYSGSEFHINWGWGGLYNGNFSINNLVPDGLDYDFGQKISIGIEAERPEQKTISGTVRNFDYIINWGTPENSGYEYVGLDDCDLELWDGNKRLAKTKTNSNGSFSFVVDEDREYTIKGEYKKEQKWTTEDDVVVNLDFTYDASSYKSNVIDVPVDLLWRIKHYATITATINKDKISSGWEPDIVDVIDDDTKYNMSKVNRKLKDWQSSYNCNNPSPTNDQLIYSLISMRTQFNFSYSSAFQLADYSVNVSRKQFIQLIKLLPINEKISELLTPYGKNEIESNWVSDGLNNVAGFINTIESLQKEAEKSQKDFLEVVFDKIESNIYEQLLGEANTIIDNEFEKWTGVDIDKELESLMADLMDELYKLGVRKFMDNYIVSTQNTFHASIGFDDTIAFYMDNTIEECIANIADEVFVQNTAYVDKIDLSIKETMYSEWGGIISDATGNMATILKYTPSTTAQGVGKALQKISVVSDWSGKALNVTSFTTPIIAFNNLKDYNNDWYAYEPGNHDKKWWQFKAGINKYGKSLVLVQTGTNEYIEALQQVVYSIKNVDPDSVIYRKIDFLLEKDNELSDSERDAIFNIQTALNASNDSTSHTYVVDNMKNTVSEGMFRMELYYSIIFWMLNHDDELAVYIEEQANKIFDALEFVDEEIQEAYTDIADIYVPAQLAIRDLQIPGYIVRETTATANAIITNPGEEATDSVLLCIYENNNIRDSIMLAPIEASEERIVDFDIEMTETDTTKEFSVYAFFDSLRYSVSRMGSSKAINFELVEVSVGTTTDFTRLEAIADEKLKLKWYYNDTLFFEGYNTKVKATQNGSYKVIYTDNEYSYTSNKIVLSSLTGLKKIENKPDFNIYPNPTNGEVFIDCQNISGKVKIEVCNMNGQTIFKNNYYSPQNIAIQLKDEAVGICLVKIATERELYIRKLIID